MSDSCPDPFEFTCNACHETFQVAAAQHGSFMPCPGCGLSVAVVDETRVPKMVELPELTAEELAYITQHNASHAFRNAKGLRRVAHRVFRLGGFQSWEQLFKQATDFANQLAPEALINISHSGGEGWGAHAATVWYWEIVPVSEKRIKAVLEAESTGVEPKGNAPTP